jgi:exonuclease-1
VEFVVAPYEADAQLAWLAKLDSLMGGVSAVISEDSDLIAYGCPVVGTMDPLHKASWGGSCG